MPSVFVWSLILIGLLIVAFIMIARVKKSLMRPDDPAGGGFTLADLRVLHRGGKITDEEFEKAKQTVLAAAQRAAEREAQQKKDVSATNRLAP